jgi:hypothetical protein
LPISKRFKSLKVTYDAKGRRKKFATPICYRRISHNGPKARFAEMAVPDIRTERADVYSRSRHSKAKPAARFRAENALKPLSFA